MRNPFDNREDYTPDGFGIFSLTFMTKFHLGNVVGTPNVMELIDEKFAALCLARHSLADWGNVSEEDRIVNDEALRNGGRLHSVYKDLHGETFWIITEADRSVTTILMPEDY